MHQNSPQGAFLHSGCTLKKFGRSGAHCSRSQAMPKYHVIKSHGPSSVVLNGSPFE